MKCLYCITGKIEIVEKVFYSEYNGQHIRINLKVNSCNVCHHTILNDQLIAEYKRQYLDGINNIEKRA